MASSESQTDAIKELLRKSAAHHKGEAACVDAASSTLERFQITVKSNDSVVSKMYSFTEDTSSAVLQMLSSLEEVDDQMGALNKIVEDTLVKTSEMSEGFSEVTTHTQELAHESDELASSISEIIQSIHLVEQHAATNRELSQKVTTHAKAGVTAINRSAAGMSSIRVSFDQMNTLIMSLGGRADEIESILKVINHIAEKTNLLALNAAIIAAEAGEQGRSFTVVADEIRQLAAQTSASTNDIEGKIASVQSETSKVIAKMQESLEQVSSGEATLDEAVETLGAITDSSHESDEMSQTIASATVEQAKVSRQIGEVTNRIQSYLHQIAQSMKSQEVSANQLDKSSEQVRDLSMSVQHATQEQRDAVSRLNSQIELIYEMAQELRDDSKSQSAEAIQLADTITELSSFVESSGYTGKQLVKQFEQLRKSASTLDVGLEFLTRKNHTESPEQDDNNS